VLGRPAVPIDEAELERLCAMQCTEEEIAAWFGISKKTIGRRRKTEKFLEAMERGKAKGRVSLRRNLWKLANAGNVAACIFPGKEFAGVPRHRQHGAQRPIWGSDSTGRQAGSIAAE
jgi:hypothetical protein